MAGGGISATRGEAADEDGGDDAAEEAHDVGKLRLTRLRSEVHVAARKTDERESPSQWGPTGRRLWLCRLWLCQL